MYRTYINSIINWAKHIKHKHQHPAAAEQYQRKRMVGHIFTQSVCFMLSRNWGEKKEGNMNKQLTIEPMSI